MQSSRLPGSFSLRECTNFSIHTKWTQARHGQQFDWHQASRTSRLGAFGFGLGELSRYWALIEKAVNYCSIIRPLFACCNVMGFCFTFALHFNSRSVCKLLAMGGKRTTIMFAVENSINNPSAISGAGSKRLTNMSTTCLRIVLTCCRLIR